MRFYVENRVTEIRQETSVSRWSHFQIENDPVDICSRRVKSLEDLL